MCGWVISSLKASRPRCSKRSAASGERHDLHWLHEHLPADGSVRVTNETARYGTLILVGPKSRDVLAKLTTSDLSNAAFPWLSVRTIAIGYTKALAMRVNYVGELGWELHIPVEHVASIYDLLFEAGEEFGIADFGLYAMDSLRLEKCYRSWKQDLTTDYTPFMASLDRFVKLDKAGGFIGQEPLRKEAVTGPKERFVPLIVDAADADASAVSAVSAVPATRAALVERQREAVAAAVAQQRGVVMEGRDIGTVVLPQADLKVWLYADPLVRAARRAAEDVAAGRLSQAGVQELADELARRDHADSTRADSPTRQADDAVPVDATQLTLPQVIATVVRLVEDRRPESQTTGVRDDSKDLL